MDMETVLNATYTTIQNDPETVLNGQATVLNATYTTIGLQNELLTVWNDAPNHIYNFIPNMYFYEDIVTNSNKVINKSRFRTSVLLKSSKITIELITQYNIVQLF